MEMEDPALIEGFAKLTKLILEKAGSLAATTPTKANLWLANIKKYSAKDEEDVLPVLIKLAWPDITTAVDGWQEEMVAKFRKHKNKAVKFVQVAKMLLPNPAEAGSKTIAKSPDESAGSGLQGDGEGCSQTVTESPNESFGGDPVCADQGQDPNAEGSEDEYHSGQEELSDWEQVEGINPEEGVEGELSDDELEIGTVAIAVPGNFENFSLQIMTQSLQGSPTRGFHEYGTGMDRSLPGIEFRVIVAQRLDPNDIIEVAANSVPHNMTWHRDGHYYYFMPNPPAELLYKYFLKRPDRLKETLPEQRAFRKVITGTGGHTTLYDVATFSKSQMIGRNPWKSCLNEYIGWHLPRLPGFLNAKTEIYGWTNQLKLGWRIGSKMYYCDEKILEKRLTEWLEMVIEQTDKSGDVITCVICTLAVAHALKSMDHRVETNGLLFKLFRGFQIEDVDDETRKSLIMRIKKDYGSRHSSELRLHAVSESILFVVGTMPELVSVWRILVLPLYWLVSGYALQNHPNLPGLPIGIREEVWNEIIATMAKEEGQRDLKSIAATVEKCSLQQPKFADAYGNFIIATTLVDLISEDAGICYRLGIEAMANQILTLLVHLKTTASDKAGHVSIGPQIARWKTCIANILASQSFFRKRFENLQQELEAVRHSHDEVGRRITTAHDVLRTLTKHLKKLTKSSNGKFEKYVVWLAMIASYAENCLTTLISVMKVPLPAPVKDTLHSILRVTIDWILQKPRNNKKGIKICDELLLIKWIDKSFSEKWESELLATVEANITKVWFKTDSAFAKFYLSEMREAKLCESLSRRLEREAFSLLREAFMQKETPYLLSWIGQCIPASFTSGSSNVFTEVFMEEFDKFHKLGTDAKSFKLDTMRFLGSSPLPLQFFQILREKADLAEELPDNVRVCVTKVKNVATNLLEALPTASVTKPEIDVLDKHKTTLEEVLHFFDSSEKKKHCDRLDLQYIVNLYQDKWREYEGQCRTMKTFVNVFSMLDRDGIAVYYPELKKVYERDPKDLKICNLHKGFPTSQEMDDICDVASMEGSRIFPPIFRKVAKNKKQEASSHDWVHVTDGKWKINWKKALKVIWSETKQELQSFIESMLKGTIERKDILSAFAFTRGEITEIHTELLCLYEFYLRVTKEKDSAEGSDFSAFFVAGEMEGLIGTVTSHAAQISSIFELQKSIEILDWIKVFKEKNQLNVTDLEDLSKLENFGDIDIGLVERFSEMVKMKRDHLNTLKAFTEQQPLIEWLQETIKSEDGLRVLCAMAVESTREVPLHMDKWSFLSDVVACFERLIFNLDKITGIKDLMERCGETCQKVEADKGLLQIWTDAGKSIEWYKENASVYGADETTSLKYARDVNERGVYTVGMLIQRPVRDDAGSTSNGDFDEITLQNCVSLKLKPNATGEEKRADLDSLHETESKLMLIAGDEEAGQKDVNHFVNLLKAVENLAQAYVNLIKAGCMLFSNWTAVISSSRIEANNVVGHELNISVTFKSDERSLNEGTNLQDISQLASILRETHTKWNNYIDKKRLKHYFLNDYNIQQIKYLCSKLATMERSPLPDKAYVLLSSMPKHSVTSLIQDALDVATRITDEEDEQEEVEEESEARE